MFQQTHTPQGRKTGYKAFLALLLFCSLLLISCNDAPTIVDQSQSTVIAKINMVTDSILKATKVPGIVIGVWDQGRSLSLQRGYGFDNPVSKTTLAVSDLFRIGSNTKSFVITVILQLADEGKLKLTDKVSDYFPQFPRGNEVTLHHLCTMSSGIFSYTELDEFWETYQTNPLKKWAPEELIELATAQPNKFHPGTGYYYSNTNTVMLGRIIETKTGKTLGDALRERILIPFGLKNTTFPSDHRFPGLYIHGWRIDSVGTQKDVSEFADLSWGWAAGAMISNVFDVKKYVELLIRGGMISDSLQLKRTNDATIIHGNIKYGYGIFTFGDGYWGHNGALDGYTSIMMHHPIKNRTIVVFVNTYPEGDVTGKVFSRIAQVLEE